MPTNIKCIHCGNNPTHHLSAYIHNTLDIWRAPMDRVVIGGSLGRMLGRALDFFKVPFFELFRFIGIVKYVDQPMKFYNDRSKVIWEEAKAREIPIWQMIFLGRPIDVFKAKPYGRTILFKGLPRTEESGSLMWMDDKYELKRFFKKHGIPVADGGSFSRFSRAANTFQTLTKPVIVKPRLGSRGRHTNTHINTPEELKKAFTIAKALGRFVIMEEHLVGSVYRGTVVGGELVGVLAANPPRVTGDGVSTVRQLAEEKNKNNTFERVKDIKITPQTEEFIGRSGHTLETILPKGHMIDLTEKVGLSYGGYSREELDITHPKTKEILTRAGQLLEDPVIGFDFIIEDITLDPDIQKWGIIEANSLPFIDLHHHPLEGEPQNIAGKVWDLWKR